ncbi:MAG: hypothetical protein IT186_03140 [Acidobacteria bacterium]|nr:hypothetical protein [Acidobacteriota bacterium]MCG3194397.1 Periplasmic dipeptide transport protein [Thermoanaerobaculia bacterium]MCK6681093.1 ABC transporter substrate-binding protein [Thermoanaerobaculia bacterium]
MVLQVMRDVEGIDPHLSGQLWQTQSLLSNVYEGLAGFDHHMAIYPALAQSWTNRDDFTWDFQIRQGVRFHCGGLLTPADVVYSFERARTHPDSVLKSSLSMIEKVEEIPGGQIRVRTRQPDGSLISRLASVFVMPRPRQGSDGADEGTAACGTGPYQLERWERGRYLRLKAFEPYWRGRGRISEGWVVSVPVRTPGMRELLPKDHLLVFWARPGSAAHESAARQMKPMTGPSLSVTYLGFDLRNAVSPGVKAAGRPAPNPFLEKRVREAIARAIDYADLDHRLGGAGGGIVSQLVPALVFGFDPSINPLHRDLARARALMAETRFKDGFEVEFDVRSVMSDYAGPLVTALESIGIRAKLNVLEEDAFFGKLEAGKSSLYLLRFSCRSGDAQEFYDRWVHSKVPEKGLGAANFSYDVCPLAGLDRQIEASRGDLNMPSRKRQLQAIMRQVVEERLAVPVFNEQEFAFLPPGLEWPPRADTFKLFYEADYEVPGQE